MDLLLVHPGDRQDIPSENLGLAGLKSFIEQFNFTADTLDLTLEHFSLTDAPRFLYESKPKVIGLSMLDQTKTCGIDLVNDIRQRGYCGTVIAGGYFPTFHAPEILENIPGIDFIVRGEGEYTLLELMNYLSGRSKQSLSDIAGISYRSNGQVIDNPPRPLIGNLDHLPVVDRKYAKTVFKKTGHLRIYASRGCWANCSFCDINSFYSASPGRKWRTRSIPNFVDELEKLKETYDCDHFILNDDNFMTRGMHNQKRVSDLAIELEKRKLNLKLELMSRVDSIDRPVLNQLKKSGVRRIFLGIESFDQDQLDRFGKGTTVRQNVRALILLKQMKIDCIVSVILADAFTGLFTLIKQFFILFRLQQRYFYSRNCKISINEKLELYRGSCIYQHYKNAGLLTCDHWFHGYKYRVKLLTALRLKLVRLEKQIYNHFFIPLKNLSKIRFVHVLFANK